MRLDALFKNEHFVLSETEFAEFNLKPLVTTSGYSELKKLKHLRRLATHVYNDVACLYVKKNNGEFYPGEIRLTAYLLNPDGTETAMWRMLIRPQLFNERKIEYRCIDMQDPNMKYIRNHWD